jgi:hypothetical protein
MKFTDEIILKIPDDLFCLHKWEKRKMRAFNCPLDFGFYLFCPNCKSYDTSKQFPHS